MGTIYMFSAFIWLPFFMRYIICIYYFGYVSRYYPTSLLPPMRRVALNFMQKNRPKYQIPW